MSNKLPIGVCIDDESVAVNCGGGQWYVGDKDNRWLWLLGAVAFPEEHSLKIIDKRKHRQEHQKDMSGERREFLALDEAQKKIILEALNALRKEEMKRYEFFDWGTVEKSNSIRRLDAIDELKKKL